MHRDGQDPSTGQGIPHVPVVDTALTAWQQVPGTPNTPVLESSSSAKCSLFILENPSPVLQLLRVPESLHLCTFASW